MSSTISAGPRPSTQTSSSAISNPAEKQRPAPRKMTQRTASSCSATASAAVISPIISCEMAFSRSGRSSVMVASG